MTFTPNFLSQRDPRWKDVQLGFDSSSTIGVGGCALTSLTMFINSYGFGETPDSVNKKLVDMGSGAGFVGDLLVWGAITRAFPGIIYRNINIWDDQAASLSAIDASINAGKPVIVQLDRSPSAGLQNHWVVLVGKQENDYLMLDPWPYPSDTQPASLSDRYGFDRPPEQVITAAVWYDATGSSTTPVPTDGLYVRVPYSLGAGLNLRAQPNVSASILGKEQAGTLLCCLEPDSVAVPNIGQQNQWLQVRDPAGLTGYVAAWYVESIGATVPTTTTPTPTTPPPTTTPTTTTPPTTTPPTTTPTPTPPATTPADTTSTTTTPPTTTPTTPTPTTPPAPPTTTTPASTGLTVKVMQSVGASGLRLRAQPSMTGMVIAIEAAGAVLNVVEAADQALTRIGVEGKWLNVKDAHGFTGYVAAWFVQSSAMVKVAGAVGPAGLRLRDGPTTTANVLKVIPADTVLTLLEPAAGRIGVIGQWLKVKEPGGVTGYIAAWFVE